MIAKKNSKQRLVVNKGVEYYMLDGLEDVHREMLRLLQIIDSICKKENIEYWLDGGSLIGAIRHSGFIPWDDDLDISLLKSDYLKLIKHLDVYSNHDLTTSLFYSSENIFHCCNYFASTNVYSRSYGSIMLIPVKIDIRPLNGFENTNEGKEENNKFRDIANQLLFGKSLGFCKIANLSKEQLDSFMCNYNRTYGLMNNEQCLFSHPYFEFSDIFPLKRKDIFPIQYTQFENLLLPIPCGYENLLSKLYGKYMDMPILENRAPVACEVVMLSRSVIRCKKNIYYVTSLFTGFIHRFCRLSFCISFSGFFKSLSIKLYERSQN